VIKEIPCRDAELLGARRRHLFLDLLPRERARQKERGDDNPILGLAVGDVNGPDVRVCNSVARCDREGVRVTHYSRQQLCYALFDTGAAERAP
jgi:hypothetical protein